MTNINSQKKIRAQALKRVCWLRSLHKPPQIVPQSLRFLEAFGSDLLVSPFIFKVSQVLLRQVIERHRSCQKRAFGVSIINLAEWFPKYKLII